MAIMRKGLGVAVGLLVLSPLFAKYKIKEIEVLGASSYAAHQDFQGIVIGAFACETSEKAQTLFDSEQFEEKGILPVLLVVDNRNEFAIRLHEKDVFLIDREGNHHSTIPYHEVLLRLTLKKPLSSYSTQKELLLRHVRDENMVLDFEKKAFGDKFVGPQSSDYGVVFFESPGKDLAGIRLYLPEIYNASQGETLIFFEFNVAEQP